MFDDTCMYIGVDVVSGPNVNIVSIAHELSTPSEGVFTVKVTLVMLMLFTESLAYALNVYWAFARLSVKAAE